MLRKHKRRHIAAHVCPYLCKSHRRKAKPPDVVQGAKCRSRVGAAAAKPAADRNPLLDMNLRALRRGSWTRMMNCTGGANDQILLAIARVRGNLAIRSRLYRKHVGKGDRKYDRTQLVVTIGSATVDLKRKVDFGICRYCHFLRSAIAELTFAKSVASFAFGIVEKARRISPESTIVPVEYFSTRCLRTFSASTPIGFTHMK